MGGTLKITSASGSGTTVSVQRPLVVSKEPLTERTASWPVYPKLRVAIVDDHPTNLLVMQQQLAMFGITPAVFDYGRDLLRSDPHLPFAAPLIHHTMPPPATPQLLPILRLLSPPPATPALP